MGQANLWHQQHSLCCPLWLICKTFRETLFSSTIFFFALWTERLLMSNYTRSMIDSYFFYLPCRPGPPAPSSCWWTAHTPAGCVDPSDCSDAAAEKTHRSGFYFCIRHSQNDPKPQTEYWIIKDVSCTCDCLLMLLVLAFLLGTELEVSKSSAGLSQRMGPTELLWVVLLSSIFNSMLTSAAATN